MRGHGSGHHQPVEDTLAAIAASRVVNGLAVVRVNSGGTGGAQASPYTAKAFQTVVVDTSTGPVVVNVPPLSLTAGVAQWVTIVQDPNTSLAVNGVTINGPPGVALAEPSPANGTFTNSFAFGGAAGGGFGGETYRGLVLKYLNAGSGGGYVLGA
jgi:hypothetical protein